MEITIRHVLPEDAEEYIACHIRCWQSAYRGIIPDAYLDNMTTEHEQRTQRMKKALCNPEGTCFYCVVFEGKIIGRLIIGTSRDLDKPNAGEIMAVYLLCDFWNKGIGKKMMEFAVHSLKNQGYDEVILWALEENVRARRFYEKCGFIFDNTKKEIHIGKPLLEMRYTWKPGSET